MEPHRPTWIKQTATVFIMILWSSLMLAQNSEVNALRTKVRVNPKNIMAKCELCHAFTDYGMIDSAAKCLASLTYKYTPSPEVRISKWLTKSHMNAVVGKAGNANVAIDSAFRILSRTDPSFRIQEQVFLQALDFYLYYIECERGVL